MRGPQTPAHLEGAGAKLQPVLQELVHGGLDADALLLGQRSHREGADHHLLPHLEQAGGRVKRDGRGGVTEPQGTMGPGDQSCGAAGEGQTPESPLTPPTQDGRGRIKVPLTQGPGRRGEVRLGLAQRP